VVITRRTRPDLWEKPVNHIGHAPTGPNPRPMNGGRGGRGWLPRQWQTTYVQQGGGGGAFIEQNGIYVPLEFTNPGDPLEGGYGFCDWTDGGLTPHPGVDLNSGPSCNSDEGVQVVAPVDGVVVAVLPWDGYTSGEGNHLWFYASDPRAVAPAYVHFDHLQAFAVDEGQQVEAGQLLGTCGRTGNWACAHSHEEFCKQAPGSWWQWPYGWSLAQVQGAYYDPGWWYQQTVQKAAGHEEVPMDVSSDELAAMAPYFAMYGVTPNMQTAIMYRAALAYKRDETPGPCLTDEYPYGDRGYVRQNFTARILEWHPDDNQVYTVEVVKDGVTT
jgi:hypothetical protein